MYGQTVQEVAKQRTELLMGNPFNLFSFYLKIINNYQSKELILTCGPCWVILSYLQDVSISGRKLPAVARFSRRDVKFHQEEVCGLARVGDR